MTVQLELPTVAYQPTLLEPEQRVTLGNAEQGDGERLGDRITVLRTLGEHADDARF